MVGDHELRNTKKKYLTAYKLISISAQLRSMSSKKNSKLTNRLLSDGYFEDKKSHRALMISVQERLQK